MWWMCEGLLAKISAMEITEELKRASWEEIKRVVKQAKFFVHASRHNGEKVCLWLLPEGGFIKVVEMGDSPERKRLRVYSWNEKDLEQFFRKAMQKRRRFFKDWQIQSVDVIEENWTKAEKIKARWWKRKEEILHSLISYFIDKLSTKETFENSPYKRKVRLPKNFWQWELRKQMDFLLDLKRKHSEEGIRKGYHLYP
jgi:hypothetical protein